VSQQPHPVFRFEGKKSVSRIQFSARYKTELELSLLSICSSGKWLDQLCPTQMAYWAKIYVTILTMAAHWRAY